MRKTFCTFMAESNRLAVLVPYQLSDMGANSIIVFDKGIALEHANHLGLFVRRRMYISMAEK